MTRAINPRQAKFVTLYLRHGNATQAYIDAGYSKNGADRSAHALLRNPEVAAFIDAKRTAIAIRVDGKLVADLAELEEGLTREWRGEKYAERVAVLDEWIQKKTEAVAQVDQALKDLPPGSDPMTKAMLSTRLLEATEGIVQDLATAAKVYTTGRSESNAAGVTLLKLKGAFDSKRPPVDDPMMLLNRVAQDILLAGIKPSELLETIKQKARDAAFSVRSGDVRVDGEALAGRSGQPRRIPLFSRAPSEQPPS